MRSFYTDFCGEIIGADKFDCLRDQDRPKIKSVLTGILVVAAGAVLASVFSLPAQHIDVENPRFFLFYALCFLVAILLIPASIWARECSLMKAPGITLAAVHGQGAGRLGTKWLSYGFTDAVGGHHGGSTINFGGPEDDNLKFVFCDTRNPARNKLSCGLLFYSVSVS